MLNNMLLMDEPTLVDGMPAHVAFNTWRPEIVTAIVEDRAPHVYDMTFAEMREEMIDLDLFAIDDNAPTSFEIRDQMRLRGNELRWELRRADYPHVQPMIKDADRRKFIRVLSPESLIRLYPNICAHIICQSLGYASPRHSAIILQSALLGYPEFCEWINACHHDNAAEPVGWAIQDVHRHGHRGYMASFKMARALVQEYIQNGNQPCFALGSWF